MSESHNNLLFVGSYDDKPYLQYLKGCVGTATVFIYSQPFELLYDLETYCAPRHITGIVTTSLALLKKLLPPNTKASIDNYAGSIFHHKNLEILIISPLAQLFTVPYGHFLTKRYISKLVNAESWLQLPEFNWTLLTPSNISHEFNLALNSTLCAVDIETYKENLAIRCIGFTHLTLVSGQYVSRSIVLPLDSEFALVWAQNFLSIPAAKILQNGKYDINYLLRYNLILHNYVWDTANLMHSWYSELPKDLASLSAFFVRNSMYWKDLADTNDLQQYYLYNAKDTHQTACVLLAWMHEAPKWAHTNYLLEFPTVFPCIMAEMRGLKRDTQKLEAQRDIILKRIETQYETLRQMVGLPNFNTNSSKQVKALLHALGNKDLDSSDETAIKKAILRHPLNALILRPILDIRGDRKLISTYLRTDDDITKTSPRGSKEYKGRILYALNPHGTDTGRLASREHHFWCGLQIQNIPRGSDVKSTIIADSGFLFAESDLEQAESRDTAYITGDTKLIEAVECGRDFHSINASSFFGVPYEAIYSDANRKTLDKKLRDLAKRVNHGANYNMGWAVLIDTMGEDKVAEARRLLKLPSHYSLEDTAKHLLYCFGRTYPTVRKEYPEWIKKTIALTKRLVGATGWTRHCFSDPLKSKTALNAYIAHCPQSLNAMTLNRAWLRVFYEVALPNPTTFKLCAQIHDSILFQYKEGHEHLAHKVKELMEIPVTIKDIKGIERAFTVPAALKHGKKYWSELE